MVGLEKITQKIISDAQAHADAILAAARARVAEIEADCEQKKQELEQIIEAEAVKEGESVKMRAKSSIAMSKRDSMLSLRASLIDEAFEAALAQLIALDPTAYREMLTGLLTKVICERSQSEQDSIRLYGEDISPAKYEVLMNKKDKDAHGKAIIDGVRRATVGKLSPKVLDKLVLSDRSVNIDGGFIIRCGEIELNCSLRVLVEGVRPQLETAVASVLFDGETDQNK